MWLVRVVKAFVATSGTTVPALTPVIKQHYRLVDGEVEIYYKTIPQPSLVYDYFQAAKAIDVHNHLRQGSLALEQVWQTQCWWHRTFATLLGMTATDAFRAYQYFYRPSPETTLKKFVSKLAVQLATNNVDAGPAMGLRGTRKDTAEPPSTGAPTRPMSTLPCYSRVLKTALRAQRRCVSCHKLCSYFCTACTKGSDIVPVCNSKGRRPECYLAHTASPAHSCIS